MMHGTYIKLPYIVTLYGPEVFQFCLQIRIISLECAADHLWICSGMEAACSFQSLFLTYKTTWNHIPEDCNKSSVGRQSFMQLIYCKLSCS